MKVTLYAYWQQYEWDSEPGLRFFDSDRPLTGGKNNPARTFAGKFDLDLDIKPVSHQDMVSGLVANIEAQKTALHHEIFKLDVKISELLCIENKETA